MKTKNSLGRSDEAVKRSSVAEGNSPRNRGGVDTQFDLRLWTLLEEALEVGAVKQETAVAPITLIPCFFCYDCHDQLQFQETREEERVKVGAAVDSKNTPPKLYRRYTDLTATIDLLSRKKLVLLDPASWDDQNDSHFIRKYKAIRGAKSVLAVCFSSVGETYPHWRVFCAPHRPVKACIYS
jgi:hypothetical protein